MINAKQAKQMTTAQLVAALKDVLEVIAIQEKAVLGGTMVCPKLGDYYGELAVILAENRRRASRMRVIFEDCEYVNNHGAKPRGRGGWVFSEERRPMTVDDMYWAPGALTLIEAKRLATEHYRMKAAKSGHVGDWTVVYVQP